MLVYARSLAREQSVDPQAIADAYAEYYSPNATNKRPFKSYFDNATKVCTSARKGVGARSSLASSCYFLFAINPSSHTYIVPMSTATPRKWPASKHQGFLANVRAGRRWPHTGAGDTETNAVAHVLPVVVMRAGRPHFLRDAEQGNWDKQI